MTAALLPWVGSLTAASRWRQTDQLRGLQPQHPDLLCEGAPLAKPNTVLAAGCMALHPSEDAMVVGLRPLGDGGSIGIVPLRNFQMPPVRNEPHARVVEHLAMTRWLDMPDDVVAAGGQMTSVEWADNLLFVGGTDGNVLIGDYSPESSMEPSSLFAPCGRLSVGPAASADVVDAASGSPSGVVPTTCVRSLCSAARHGDANRLTGIYRSKAVVWDLNGGADPVACHALKTDGQSAAGEEDPLLSVEWAPQCSANVLVCSSYRGRIALLDQRAKGVGQRLLDNVSVGGDAAMVHGAQFQTAMPWVLAAAASDGVVRVYDTRFPVGPVMSLHSAQGGCTAVSWLPTHHDLLVSTGRDGTTKLWCLRSSPSYCVGVWRHRLPLSQLLTTQTFVQSRCIGMTLDGEMVSLGITDQGLGTLAPTHIQPLHLERGGAGMTEGSSGGVRLSAEDNAADLLLQNEDGVRRALAAMYVRNMKETYKEVVACAQLAVSAQHRDAALTLLELIEPAPVFPFRMDAHLEALHRAEALGLSGGEALMSVTKVRALFDADMTLYAQRIPSSVHVTAGHKPPAAPNNSGSKQQATVGNEGALLRGVVLPEAAVESRLDALRRNISIQKGCEERDVRGVLALLHEQAEAIRTSSSAIELVNAETLCVAIRWMVGNDVRFTKTTTTTTASPADSLLLDHGIAAVKDLLDALVLPDGSCPSKPLFRKIACSALSPLVTDASAADNSVAAADAQRLAKRRKRFADACFKDVAAARDAVVLQLDIRRLSSLSSSSDAIVAAVSRYQEECVEEEQLGIFSWLSSESLLLYLRSLSTRSVPSLAVFLWTAVQLLHHLAGIASPASRGIEGLFFDTLNRIRANQEKLKRQLESAAAVFDDPSKTTPGGGDVPHLRTLEPILSSVHTFVSGVLRLQMECETVAIESELDEDALPALMQSATDLLNECTSELLEVWADGLDAVVARFGGNTGKRGGAGASVSEAMKPIVAVVQNFSDACEALTDHSPRGDDDEMLQNIVDTCSDFVSQKWK